MREVSVKKTKNKKHLLSVENSAGPEEQQSVLL